jgi:KaiC/GvpD/RAD55 family RecA-like ATPase
MENNTHDLAAGLLPGMDFTTAITEQAQPPPATRSPQETRPAASPTRRLSKLPSTREGRRTSHKPKALFSKPSSLRVYRVEKNDNLFYLLKELFKVMKYWRKLKN